MRGGGGGEGEWELGESYDYHKPNCSMVSSRLLLYSIKFEKQI